LRVAGCELEYDSGYISVQNTNNYKAILNIKLSQGI